MASFKVNGRSVTADVDDSTPLLWVLRDSLNLTGTKYGCGVALCGACTVHLDGQPVRSCVTPVADIDGASVVTIEQVGGDRIGRAVQEAWVEKDVPQCGYCQSGQVMSAVALLRDNAAPGDSDIDEAMEGNICRCGTYGRVRAALMAAAASLS